MPGRVRRQIFAIAISAPVLPAETAASASPFLTASMAIHIEETRRPWRSATLGFSSMRIDTAECRTSERSASAGKAANSAENRRPLAKQQKKSVGTTLERQSRSGDGRGGTKIAAHRVERDPNRVGPSSYQTPECRHGSAFNSLRRATACGRASSRSCGRLSAAPAARMAPWPLRRLYGA